MIKTIGSAKLIETAAIVFFLTLPWLVPPQGGPSPATGPWLLSMAILIVLLVWGAVSALDGKRWSECFASAWLVAALVSSGIGLCQYFGVEQLFHPWVSASVYGEAISNLRQRNQFASLTNMGLMALLWLIWYGGDKASPWWAAMAAVLLGLGNASSASRTGLVQLLLITCIAIQAGAWRRPAVRTVLFLVVAAYVVAAFLLPELAGFTPDRSGIVSRFQNSGLGCASRIILWQNMLELVSHHPWSGWGVNELDYAHFMTTYGGPRFCEMLDNAHNLPLQLAVELGLPVAVLVCGMAVWLIWRARPWREIDPARQLAWGVLAVIMVHSMLEYPLWYGPFQMSLVLCMGLLWSSKSPASQSSVSTFGGAWLHVTALMFFAAIAYAAWDYHRVSQIYLPPEQRAAAYRDNTLEKIRGSWLFRDQVQFAEFTLTSLTFENAAQLNAMAHELLHFSPEARVVEKLIESAVVLGRDDEARLFMARYQAAYPQAYERWRNGGRQLIERK